MTTPVTQTMGPPGHITSPTEPYPSPEALARATTTHRQGRFAISTRKLPISKAGPIDAMSADLGIPIPEMIFGDNLVRVAHDGSGWSVAFTARDALDAVDKTGDKMLQVSYARDWSASRERTSAGIQEVVKPFDWSYSTEYRGTVAVEQEGAANKSFAPSDRPIPIELLKRRDPILFFDDVILYESEMDDNGISIYSVKVRVHEERMLLLARLFMRLDNVVVRIRDTRIYVDFATEEVIREYTAKEAGFEDVKRKLLMTGLRPDEVPAALRDANQIAELLKDRIVDGSLESVKLGS
ncbi:hypothetical protein PFICI_08172 [Pestalotiopsis fici W106-1]|uniref:Type 2A phosphatase activator TIP41 n=1 Tax=Pestalotiopsis fici (strain W106-1 / CGMCC3.15140) TaxID=1229662 RepID=W3X3D1_PESFW|nr:uncharacterized protein PFICI_08172 [Pestalotiopsis fici W106-1]ETS80643.1 hypothetical protein PFICI_08172 [Pestalotiopsis fici W106-1]